MLHVHSRQRSLDSLSALAQLRIDPELGLTERVVWSVNENVFSNSNLKT